MKDIFIKCILEILDDIDIQNKIIDIVGHQKKENILENNEEKGFENITKKEELSDLILNYGKNIDKLEKDIKSYENNIEVLKKNLSEEKSDNVNNLEKIKLIEERNKELLEEKNDLIKEKNNLMEKLEDIEEKNKELENKKISLIETIENCIILSEKLEKEKEKLVEEKSKLKIRVDEIKINYDNISEEKNKLSDKLRRSTNINNDYEQKYGQLESLYKSYIELNEKIHKDLLRVIRFTNTQVFLSSGVQWSNIEGLWDTISYKLSEYNENEIDVLNQIFDYFFNIYMTLSENYERLDVSVGEEFDEEMHTRSSNSKTVNGKIKKVLLTGYKNKSNNKIKKSIVRL